MKEINQEKNIIMKYPYDCTGENDMFDGNWHEIVPRSIKPIVICGNTFYILYYFDITMNTQAVTVLAQIDNMLVKVPLDDYNVLFDYLDSHYIEEIEITSGHLPRKIPLAQTLSARHLLLPPPSPSGEKQPEQVFRFEEFIPVYYRDINDLAKGGEYSADCIITEPYSEIEEYKFSRVTSYIEKNGFINKGLSIMSGANLDNFNYSFRINVPEGTTASVTTLSKNGELYEQIVFLIPGIHEYTIHYSTCVSREDFINSRQAEKIKIFAPKSEYRDFHDIVEVFDDGCKKILPMNFYSADGQNLSDKMHNYR